jgi:hypothetical protein
VRILVSCLQGPPGYSIPAYDFWRTHLKNGIEEAGHEFTEVEGADWVKVFILADAGERAAWRATTWQRTVDFIRREHRIRPFDLFLSYFFPRQIDRTAIREIQQIGIPCVNFFCDNVREFQTIPKEFTVFDLHWVPETKGLEMYRAARLQHIWLPMPCWVPQEFRLPSPIETEMPTFIGRGDLMRRELFGRAFQAGANFQIRGAGWEPNGQSSPRRPESFFARLANQLDLYKSHGIAGLYSKLINGLTPPDPLEMPVDRLGPPVSNSEYNRLTREAKVTLGVSRVPTASRPNRNPLTYSRLRDLEAPMLGACYLTEWSSDLDRIYELGEEIEVYRSADELVEKLNYLLSAPEKRRSLRVKGQRRALTSHSIPSSISKIWSALGIKA